MQCNLPFLKKIHCKECKERKHEDQKGKKDGERRRMRVRNWEKIRPKESEISERVSERKKARRETVGGKEMKTGKK